MRLAEAVVPHTFSPYGDILSTLHLYINVRCLRETTPILHEATETEFSPGQNGQYSQLHFTLDTQCQTQTNVK